MHSSKFISREKHDRKELKTFYGPQRVPRYIFVPYEIQLLQQFCEKKKTTTRNVNKRCFKKHYFSGQGDNCFKSSSKVVGVPLFIKFEKMGTTTKYLPTMLLRYQELRI